MDETLSGVDAEAHLSDVLKAVSGNQGLHNAKSILKEQASEALKKAEVHKAQGNAFFVENKFQEALSAYQSAVELLQEFDLSSLDSDARKFLVAVHSNAAQVYLKLGDGQREYEGALSAAEKALAVEPTHLKSRFRRGCALTAKGDFNLARADFEYVLRVDPKNDVAKRQLQALLKQQRNEEAAAGWESIAASAIKAEKCTEVPASPLESATSPKGTLDTESTSSKGTAALILQQQVDKAARLHAGLMRFWDSNGGIAEWKAKMLHLRKTAEKLTAAVLQNASIAEKAGRSLSEIFGHQGEALTLMDSEQRETYFKADAFITAVKESHPEHFAEIVAEAAKCEPLTSDDGMVDPRLVPSDLAAQLLDGNACGMLGDEGVVVLEAISLLSVACLAKLRSECQAADKYGVLKIGDSGLGNHCRWGIVRDTVLQAEYKDSALLKVNDVLRGLGREIIRKVPFCPDDPKLCLGVPDELHLLAFDKEMHLSKRLDVEMDARRVWGALLFVNPNWSPGDGGEVVVDTANATYKIEPRPGRMIVFDAGLTWYEVTSAEADDTLFSIFFWLHAVNGPGYWFAGDESD